MRGGCGLIYNNRVTRHCRIVSRRPRARFPPEYAQGTPYLPWGISGCWDVSSLTHSGTTATATVTVNSRTGTSIGHSLTGNQGEYCRIIGATGADASLYNGTFSRRVGPELNAVHLCDGGNPWGQCDRLY